MSVEFQIIFAITSIIIYFYGFIPYIYHVYHGRVCPHPFSWTVLIILSVINTFWFIATSGIDLSSSLLVIRTGCLCIWAVIWWIFIRRVEINYFDYLCLFLGICSIGIVYFFGISKAIIPTILIDVLVLSPTLKKIWITPHSEDSLAWITTMFSQFFFLLSLSAFTVESTLYWIYVMIVNGGVAVFIILRTRYLDRWSVRIWRFFSFFFSRGKT